MENIPIYIKVDEYKQLLETLHALQNKLASVNGTIEKINKLKAQEDAQVAQWNENLTDIKARLEKVNQAFYEK